MDNEQRKFCFEYFKHVSTLNVAGIVLVLGLTEKFLPKPYDAGHLSFVVGDLGIFASSLTVCLFFMSLMSEGKSVGYLPLLTVTTLFLSGVGMAAAIVFYAMYPAQ